MAPIDLRIDHVYLISCKYESDILANASPGRVFDGLLATSGDWERGDWYEAVAPAELGPPLPGLRGGHRTGRTSRRAPGCTREQLAAVRAALGGRSYPDAASRAAYAELCRAVSAASAGDGRATASNRRG